MQISNQGLQLTEESEGLKLRAYQDTGGVWTIGYGHTRNVGPGQVITQEYATTLLNADIQAAMVVVNQHCLPCTQGQFDALTDFVFNVGAVQFLSSHLFTYHKTGQYDKAADEFPKWKYDNGKVIPGLVARRAKERALYTLQEPQADHPHTPEPEHSAEPTVGSVSVSQGPSVVPPFPVPAAPTSDTAEGSSSGFAGFVSQVGGMLSNLLGMLKQKP